MKINYKIILLVIVQFVFTFLLLEAFFRYYFFLWNSNRSVPFLLFGRAFPDSAGLRDFIQPSREDGIIFELKPSIRSQLFEKPFNTNSQGALGIKEFPFDKPENTVRIVGVGDSFMSSWGNDMEDIYMEKLGRRLNENFSPKSVEMINLSVPGYNTAIEKRVIETKALDYHPDLIILHFCGNDMDLPNYIRRQVHAKSYAYYVIKHVIEIIYSKTNKNWAISNPDVFQGLSDTPLDNEFMTSREGWYRFAYKMGEVPKEYEYMTGRENYETIMKNISDLGKTNGVPILLITESWVLRDSPGLKNMGFKIIVIDEILKDYMDKNNLENRDIRLSDQDDHLNALGHSIYAKLIYDFIESDAEIKTKFI